jgi:hypothetical protein
LCCARGAIQARGLSTEATGNQKIEELYPLKSCVSLQREGGHQAYLYLSSRLETCTTIPPGPHEEATLYVLGQMKMLDAAGRSRLPEGKPVTSLDNPEDTMLSYALWATAIRSSVCAPDGKQTLDGLLQENRPVWDDTSRMIRPRICQRQLRGKATSGLGQTQMGDGKGAAAGSMLWTSGRRDLG